MSREGLQETVRVPRPLVKLNHALYYGHITEELAETRIYELANAWDGVVGQFPGRLARLQHVHTVLGADRTIMKKDVPEIGKLGGLVIMSAEFPGENGTLGNPYPKVRSVVCVEMVKPTDGLSFYPTVSRPAVYTENITVFGQPTTL